MIVEVVMRLDIWEKDWRAQMLHEPNIFARGATRPEALRKLADEWERWDRENEP